MKKGKLIKLGVSLVIFALTLVVWTGISLGAAKEVITIWAWDERATGTIKVPILEFEKLNPDVEVKALNFGVDDAHNKVLTALAAGVGAPDIYFMEMDQIGRYIALGGAQDITAGMKPYEDLFPPAYWKSYVSGGRVFGVPWDGGPSAVFYRKDIFDEEGVEFPKSWQEYAQVGRKMAKDLDGDGEIDRYMGLTFSWLTQQWIQGRGGEVTNEEGQVLFDNPVVSEVVQWVSDRIRKDRSMKYKEPWDPESFEMIKTDKYLTVPVAYWYVGFGLQKFAYRPELEGKWRAARWLPWQEGDSPTGANAGGSGWLVSPQAKNVKICVELLKYICARKESQVHVALEHGVFPVNMEALEELGKQPLAFFGGQKVYQLLLEELEDTPPLTYGPEWSVIMGSLQRAIDRVVLEGAVVEEAIKDAVVEAKGELR